MTSVDQRRIVGRSATVRRTINNTIDNKLPLVLTLTVIGLFIPEELSFYLLGLRLTVVRFLFLLLAPLLLVKTIQKLSSGGYRFVLSDLLVVAIGFWFLYAPANVEDLQSALNHAGPIVLEFCIAYFVPRIMIPDGGAALSFAALLSRTIAVVAWVGLLDTLTSHRFTHDLAAQLTAPMHNVDDWSDAYRMGLFRATGPVEHPILFGFVCAVGLLIAVAIPMRGRRFVILSCCLGTMISLSSAPIQIMVMGLGLLAYDRFLVRFAKRWLALIVAATIAVLITFMINDNPIGFVISHLTFSPESGYYREWTWEAVLAYVSQSPWFGAGFGELPEELNHSIDSLWLVLSIQFGYPAAWLVGFAFVSAGSLFRRGGKLPPEQARLATAIGIILFLTIDIACTVHLWGCVWILSGVLLGLRARLTELAYLAHVAGPQGAILQRSVLRA